MSSVAAIRNQPLPARTALVVDADPEIESVLTKTLDPAVWHIEHAPDNRAVLALAQSRPFDLILTSEKTSGREDLELLRRIRRVRPHIRLIILTDEATPAEVIASMRERAFSYFSKPFSLSALAEMIQLAADGPCWDEGIEILSATPAWIRLLARCDLKTAERLLQFINEIADLPDDEKFAVGAAFREMLLNAMEHGGQFKPDEYVEISYLHARHMVLCRVKDPGKGFSLDELRHAAFANPPDDPVRHMAHRDAQGLRPGGYGIMLARRMVDELIYNEKGNDVVLIKYLDPVPGGK